MVESPAVSVVVASHGREIRLRWLLNALESQTFEDAWEAIVVHDYDEETAERVIVGHPLAKSGKLIELRIEPGTGSPARQRNIGWRAARGPLVAFTDDDCRPEPDWLQELLVAAAGGEDELVQGRTRPDPLEHALLAAPHFRTLRVDPVGPYFQTANMLYPRALLERLGGFDELAISGEDVGLALRAFAAGARVRSAPAAIVNHAIESHSLPGILRQNLKWRHLAYLVKRHPEFRTELTARVFWDRDHLLATTSLLGAICARHDRRALVLVIPQVIRLLGRRGWTPKSVTVAAFELPGQGMRQAGEVVGMAIGSLRHRTALL